MDAFAAGAILTMLADTMMPEAFAYGGKLVGLMTTFGFALAVGLAALERIGSDLGRVRPAHEPGSPTGSSSPRSASP